MQISDMLGKYNQNAASIAVQEQAAKTGIQQLTESLLSLKEGNVFEGTIKAINGTQVLLALANGENINARIQGKINLQLQQSMFFEVKSNCDSHIEIKPYLNGNSGNATLLKALTEAGLASTKENLEMVKFMMEEQMPIDKQSLNVMAKHISTFPQTNVSTLVQMNKLGIILNEANIQQFSNYQSDTSSILNELDGVLEQLPQSILSENLSPEQMLQKNNTILQILLPKPYQPATEQSVQLFHPSELQTETEWMPKAVENMEIPQQGAETPVLNETEVQNLKQQLEQLGIGQESKLFNEQGGINGKPEEFLLQMQKELEQLKAPSKEELEKLFSGKEFKALLKNGIEQQWFLQPENIKEKNTVQDLYEKLQQQMSRLEQFVKQNGLENTGLKKAVATVRNNIEFMNEMNHLYNFIQIPLKMHGQNVNSELYVYSNKKNLRDSEGELSAFLHLDMDHLGSTDISIKLKGMEVKTDFYMGEDASYELILTHAKELAERLKEKGYGCQINVENQENKMDFVDDFLKQDMPDSGRLYRYSFDMRA